MDYAKFYDLESYIFNDVRKKFHEKGYLEALDFFCILVWKANRAKSKTAKRLLKIQPNKKLNDIIIEITSDISSSATKREKLMILLKKWRFRLPTASAILSALYPSDFTIYDVRVCGIIGKFKEIPNYTSCDKIIDCYFNFIECVRNLKEVEDRKTFREKDRYLWGKSFYEDLAIDIKNNFKKR